MTKKILLSLVAVALFVGCSDDSNDSPRSAVDSRLTQLGLITTWKAPCKNVVLDLFRLSAQQEALTFTDNDVTRETIYYAQDNCTEPTVKVDEKGNHGNIEKTAENADTYKIDINWKTASVTPASNAGRDLLNTIGFCGITSWVTGETREVTEQTSESPVVDRCWSKVPSDQFDLMAIRDGTLYLGTGSDKSTSDKRPTSLDTNVPYTK